MRINLIIISLFLLVSVGFTFMLTLSTFYQSEDTNISKFDILESFLSGELKNSEEDVRKIIEILKQDENIGDKFIMASSKTYSYYTDSKLIYAQFTEGPESGTIKDFITKKDWSYYERYFSAINSIPVQENLDIKQNPDYLIYTYTTITNDPNTTWYKNDNESTIRLLSTPDDPDIPEFLNPIFFSSFGTGGIVVYEVNLEK